MRRETSVKPAASKDLLKIEAIVSSETSVGYRRTVRPYILENRTVHWFCPNLTRIGMCRQSIVKLHHVRFHGHPFSGSRVVSCLQTDGRTDKWTNGRGRKERPEGGMNGR